MAYDEHEHDEPVCDHPDCEAGRIVALRISAFLGNDYITAAAVSLIMEVRDCGYTEAVAWALTFLTRSVEEAAILEMASTVDEELRELTEDV